MHTTNQFLVIRRIQYVFILLATIFFTFGGKHLATVNAQTGPCGSGQVLLASLDGVDFQLCLPYSPDHSSTAESHDWVQSGVWIKDNPNQEFSIYTVPYGVIPAGDNLPVAGPEIADLYKKATLDHYQSDSIVLIDGPSISLFGNSVKGATYLLPDKNGASSDSQKLVTEWIVEKGSRVWIIYSNFYGNFDNIAARMAALDTLNNISVESQTLANPSTSLAERQRFLTQRPKGTIVEALSDLPAASWWNGDCDTNRYLQLTGTSAYRLGATYRGLVACGPGGVGTGTYQYGITTLFGGTVGTAQLEFQCAELPKRYLKLLYGLAPRSGNGIDVVNAYDNALPNLKKVSNGTPNSGLAAGDIISYNGPTSAGHTAIITSVTIDGSGNGSYTTIEQNSSASGTRTNSISNWYLNSNSGISVYLHDSGGSTNDNPPSGFTKCADEGGRCNFSGTADVVYGARSSFTSPRSFTDGVDCNNNVFTDPISGVTKACYYKITTPPSGCPSVSGEVRLFDLTNCGGDSTTASGTGLWSMASSFNDRAESIAIPGGWSARLYQNDNENSSESACFGSTDANLNDNTYANGGTVGNSATWMRVYDNTSCTGAVSAPSAPSLSSPGNGSNNPASYDLNFQWNGSSGASEYLLEWWGGPYSTMQPCGWGSATSCHVGVVAAGNTYSWHVKARNAGGESGWSDTWTFAIQSNTAPDLVVQSISPSTATPALNQAVTFTVRVKNQGNGDATSSFYMDLFVDAQPGSCPTDGITYWTVTSLAAGATQDFTYDYPGFSTTGTHNVYAIADSYCSVTESNESNNTLGPVTLNVQQTQPPAAPTLNSPSNGTTISRTTSVNLSWNASSGATEYYAEFWGGPNLNLNSGWTSNTSWSIGSQWGGSYQWRVKARNAGGESGWSSETRSLIIKYGSPAGLSASPASSTQINLSWSASADAPGNIDGYRIYRNGSAAGTVGASTTTFNDTGRTCATTYSYVVKAYKGSSESDASNTASATTPTCTVNPPAAPVLSSPGNGTTLNRTDSVYLTWNTSSGATEYYAEFWGGPNLNLNSGWKTSTSWSIGSQWGGSYQWRVKARNAGGESGWSSETRSLTIKYGSPAGLTASVISSTQIDLAWSASADAPGNIDGYRIYRNGSAAGTVSASTTSYSDTGRTCLNTYSYVVKAYKGAVESDASNTATGTTTACQSTATVSAIKAWTADDTWTPKTVFNSGDPIKNVIDVENTSTSSQPIHIVYEVKNSAGQSMVSWNGDITVDPGVSGWGLQWQIPANSGGSYTFTGSVDFQGKITQVTSTFTVTGPQQLYPSHVAASSAISTWPISLLVDGKPTTTWSSLGHADHLASADWAALILPYTTSVDRIRLYPRANPNEAGKSLGFPKDFVIQYAVNDGVHTCDPADTRFANAANWSPLITRYGYAQPANTALDFTFSSKAAQCVRMLATEESQDDFGNRFFQMSEIELYAASAKVPVSNVAVSSAISTWPKSTLIDGNTSTTWSSLGHADHLASADWAALILPNTSAVDRIRLYPRSNPNEAGKSLGFPKDFVIQYAQNDGVHTCDPADARFANAANWSPLITRYGYDQPANTALDFTFSSKQAKCVRMLATEESQDDFGNRFFQMSEIELYAANAKVPVSSVAVSSAISTWPKSTLVDGNTSTTWSSLGHADHLASADWAALILPGASSVDRIRLYPRTNPNEAGKSLGFPKDFVIQYALNDGVHTCDPADARFANAANWSPLITRYGYAQPANTALDFTFASKQAQCVRMLATEESQDDFGNRFLQMSEIELYANSAGMTALQASATDGSMITTGSPELYKPGPKK